MLKTVRAFQILFFISITSGALAQDDLKQKIDSLLAIVPQENYDDQKEGYWKINDFVAKNSNRGIELFEYALSKDSSSMAKMIFYNKLGNYYSRQGDTDKSLEIKLAGLNLAESFDDERQMVHFNLTIGNVYLYQNKPDEALKYINAGEFEALKEENKDLLWNAYYHKGLLQNMLGDVKGQREYYEKMWDAISEYPNSSTKRFVLYVLVDFYSQVDYPNDLTKYTEMLAALYEESNPNLPQGHMPIKGIFEKRTDPKNIPQLRKAIRISDSLKSMNSLTYSTIALANTYTKMGRANDGVEALEFAISKVKAVNKPSLLLDLYVKSASVSAAASNFEKAYRYKAEESNLRDSVTSVRMQRNIAELEVKFDTAKKERELVEQKLLVTKESKRKNQILIGAVGLGILLLTSFFFFRKRLKDQKVIATQKESIQQNQITELQQKNKLLALNSMIEGQEAERLRIAKDLHDSLGGLLSTVKAHFSTIQREIEELEQLNITSKTNGLIDEACLEVRRISHNMMPHALSISGLKGALEDIVENLKEQGYDGTLEVSNLPTNLDSTREIMIYRLVQEIISNIRKHADAKSVLIQLLSYKNELNLIIEDDGNGFDYEAALQKGGLGLKSINSRVEFLDGKIHWDSEQKKGTSITINIPVK